MLPLLEESEVPLQKEIGGCVFEQCQGTESPRSLCLAQVFRDSEHSRQWSVTVLQDMGGDAGARGLHGKAKKWR